MKLSYYTTLDGADPLPKLGALVRTRVEKPPLGPVLAGPTAREGVFQTADGKLFTRFEENACAPVDGEKPGSLNVHDSLYYGKLTRKALESFMSDEELVMAAQYVAAFPSFVRQGTVTGRMSCSAPNFEELPRPKPRYLARGESCTCEEYEDGLVSIRRGARIVRDAVSGIVTRVL